jgi:N utilization substance protein A
MDVIVPDDQLSLAIGRRGQNVRLAVQLTNWRIDIKSETKMREVARWLSEAVSVVDGLGDPEAELLLQQGVTSLEDLSECSDELLLQFPGIDEASSASIKQRAAELILRRDSEEEQARIDAAAADEAEREEAARVAAGGAPAEAEEAEAAADEADEGDAAPETESPSA